jgi:hypothetical protein
VLRPRLFISYSRLDHGLAGGLARALKEQGFQVFLDASDMEPGENFVTRLHGEVGRAAALVAVVSKNYGSSRWAQAELYHALAAAKPVIPVLVSQDGLSSLDEPLRRLLRDTHFVRFSPAAKDGAFNEAFAQSLVRARRRHLRDVAVRALPLLLGAGALAMAAWWAVTNLNEIQQARSREALLNEIAGSVAVFPHQRISAMAAALPGDKRIVGDLLVIAQDRTRSDPIRFNAMATASEMDKGRSNTRWYVQNLLLDGAAIRSTLLSNISFIGGGWRNVEVTDSTLAGVFFAKRNDFQFSGVKFSNVEVIGGGMEAVGAIDVEFENTKFRGAVLDTTNFAGVRFVTVGREIEGHPVITPSYTLVERTLVISGRKPPDPRVLDLSGPGSDVLFKNVVFVECRLEGFFRPEWFQNCSFDRCTLPDSLSKAKLVAAGNTVQ